MVIEVDGMDEGRADERGGPIDGDGAEFSSGRKDEADAGAGATQIPLTSIHLRRAVGGVPESFSWLVARFSPLLLAQAAQRLGTHLRRLYDPEDIVQEAWAVALPRLADLTPRDGRLTPVVLRFLSTTVLYRIQSLMQKHLHARGGVGAAGEVGEAFSRLPDETSRQLTRLIRAEQSAALYRAIESLAEEDRRIVVLRGIEQCSVQEVATLVEMKPNTVSVRFRRALEQLRRRFPGSVFDEMEGSSNE